MNPLSASQNGGDARGATPVGIVGRGRLGTALGLFADADLYDCTVELAAGEVLCLFTDGLVEARRGPEMFGAGRAGDVLAGHPDAPLDDVAGALVDAARSFHGEEALADDLALLLMRARRLPS